MKKVITLFLCILMITAAMVGCAAPNVKEEPKATESVSVTEAPKATESVSATEEPKAKDKIVVGCTLLTLQDAFYQMQKQALEEKSKELGIDVIILDAQGDLTKQTNQISDLIAQKVDAIMLVPVEPKAAEDMVKQCNDAGIPVICNSSDINADVAVKVLRDDMALGLMCGENTAKWINNNLGGKGKIAMLNFRTFSNTTAWEDGFLQKIKEISPQSEVVATIEATSREAGLKAMEDVLQAHPDVNLVWGVNDPAGLGAVQAIEGANRDDIFAVFMCGGDKEAFERLLKGTKEGKVAGILQIYPYEDGNASLQAAYDLIQGKKVEKLINTPGVWWDENNVKVNLAAYPAYPKG